MRSIKLISTLTTVVALSCLNLNAQAPQYEVTVLLENANQETATVYGLNNLNEAVGNWLGAAFLYTNGIMMDLAGSIGGNSSASDINDKGQIVGSVFLPYSSSKSSTAFLFSLADGLKHLPGNSTAYAINNAGQIAGTEATIGEPLPAVFLENGTITTIGSSSGWAYAINDNYGNHGVGQVVGMAYEFGDEHSYPFLYADGVFLDIDPSCRYESESVGGFANAINNLGQVAAACGTMFMGYCGCALYQGYIYNSTDGSTSYLGTYAVANDINDAGWVVGNVQGNYFDGNHKPVSPFLFADGVQYNLYDLIVSNPGINYLDPVAINNQGDIAANSNLGPVLLTRI